VNLQDPFVKLKPFLRKWWNPTTTPFHCRNRTRYKDGGGYVRRI